MPPLENTMPAGSRNELGKVCWRASSFGTPCRPPLLVLNVWLLSEGRPDIGPQRLQGENRCECPGEHVLQQVTSGSRVYVGKGMLGQTDAHKKHSHEERREPTRFSQRN